MLGWLLASIGAAYSVIDYLCVVEGIRPLIHSSIVVTGLGLAAAGELGGGDSRDP